jgi:succinoglycan biosynthesis protein ExoM
MLEALLASLASVRAPEGMELAFLIIDNDESASAKSSAEAFAKTMGWQVRHIVERQPGIPLARNRALQEAHAIAADYLAFVDDDETVDADWLVELTDAAHSRRLELVGGPVLCSNRMEDIPPGFWRRLVFEGVRWRYFKKERSARRRARRGCEGDIVIVTNNWLLDLGWQKRTGLRFDERLKESGGSDALFYQEAKALGIRSGWSWNAIVREWVPPSRLTFAYQFNRARHQSMSSFERKYRKVTVSAVLAAVASCILKALGCVACIVSLPFAGGAALIQLARQSGWIVGRLQVLAGSRSSLYSRTDGF